MIVNIALTIIQWKPDLSIAVFLGYCIPSKGTVFVGLSIHRRL
tara:strand:+ start:438 stop:566 length:129 start_codon:yes stop_codon:yes gene_type:complete